MMDVLHFVFSGFWIWLGSAILLSIVTTGAWQLFASILAALQRR